MQEQPTGLVVASEGLIFLLFLVECLMIWVWMSDISILAFLDVCIVWNDCGTDRDAIDDEGDNGDDMTC